MKSSIAFSLKFSLAILHLANSGGVLVRLGDILVVCLYPETPQRAWMCLVGVTISKSKFNLSLFQ